MGIIDLTKEHEPTFLACLKDWDEDVEGMCHKARWCDMMRCKGLRASVPPFTTETRRAQRT
jgi:hypothetical protein